MFDFYLGSGVLNLEIVATSGCVGFFRIHLHFSPYYVMLVF